MAAPTAQKSSHWSSRFTFIMAAVGSAVGLGNFWRFPYQAGQNGGGAFVLVYLICVLLIVLPILIGELMIGRRGRLSAVGSVRKVALDEKASPKWSLAGWNGMIAAMLILSFYSVIAGWFIDYIPNILSGEFEGIDSQGAGLLFGETLADVNKLVIGHSIFMALTVFIVVLGLKNGIEKAVNILMPLFFVLLVALTIFSAFIGDFAAGWNFLFTFDLSKITGAVVLSALGQAFFSVGVGGAIMLTYGAYLERDTHIPGSALIIALSDTAVAIIAGLLIFPLVFGFNLNPGEGPGLIFVTLPIAFGQMPLGNIIGAAFFVLALVAAITSSISMLEILASWVEERSRLGRKTGVIVGGLAVWAVGLLTVFSFNKWAGFHPLGRLSTFQGMTIFELIDFVTGKIMLPLGGLLIALIAGWVMTRQSSRDELPAMSDTTFLVWRVLVRYLAPIAVAIILLYETGPLRALLN
ncbi:MAG: sodium-dependent transporter [Alphaproteobacteria bacterium]|nr:MAG: sodium-dependent transporter [Alphaproteobacteria bacterium]